MLFRVFCFLDCCVFFFFQAEDGILCLVRSRGLGVVYKRQAQHRHAVDQPVAHSGSVLVRPVKRRVILNRGRVEDDHVGEIAVQQPAAPVELQVVGRQCR